MTEPYEPLTCDGDPHSPYPHSFRLAGHVDGFELYRCRDCNVPEEVDPDEFADQS